MTTSQTEESADPDIIIEPEVVYAQAEASTVSTGMRSGLKWTTVSQVLRLVLQFITQLIMARLLTPADFGIAAMAFVLSGFAAVLAESGIAAAVIQRPKLDEKLLSSAFFVNFVSGLLVAIVVMGIAPLAADFYNEHDVATILYLTGPMLFIGSLASVNRGLLERKLDFRTVALIEMVASVAALGSGIAVAATGGGILAFPINGLVFAIISTVGAFATMRWIPRCRPSWAGVKDLAGFSGNLLTFNAVNYWSRNFDNLLVARFLGATQAGFYTRAYGFLMLPLTQMSAVLGRVMFPSLSTLQDDKARIRAIYLKAMQNISAIMWLPLLMLAVTADRLIPFLLGAQWRPASTIVSVFALLGTLQVINTTVGWLYMSQGATRVMLKWGLITTAVFSASFVLGVWLGTALWVAITFALAFLLTWIPVMRSACQLVDLPTSRVLAALVKPAGCAGVAAITSAPGFWIANDSISFAYQLLAGSLAYVILALHWGLEPFTKKRTQEIARKLTRRRA